MNKRGPLDSYFKPCSKVPDSSSTPTLPKSTRLDTLDIEPVVNDENLPLTTSFQEESNIQQSSESSVSSISRTRSTDAEICSSSSSSGRKGRSTFATHSWLLRRADGFYCKVCLKHGTIIDKRSGGVWVTSPFTDINRLYMASEKHAKSSQHKRWAAGEASLQSGVNVRQQLEHQITETNEEKCEFTKLLMTQFYFLAKNELPHSVMLREIISAVATCGDPGKTLTKHYQSAPSNAHHLSSTSSTDFLNAFSQCIENNLRLQCTSINRYSLLADESTDVNCSTRLSVCIRYLRQSGVTESFIACPPIGSTKAIDIKAVICDMLNRWNLPLEKCFSISFDGASNFSGFLSTQ